MNKLQVGLKHCYGIQSLNHEFDFTAVSKKDKLITKAYAVYAPNGLMKSSFAKTFEALSKGEAPKEERYSRQSIYQVEADELPLSQKAMYVLKAEIDIQTDSPSITDILVNPNHKARYDELVVDLDKQKVKLIGALQKQSKIKKTDIEQTILKDFNAQNFPDCIMQIRSGSIDDELKCFEYATIFDPKTVEVIESQDFVTKANEFNERYQELFSQVGTIYTKGVFNPAKADTAFSTLDKQGFFAGGHRVHLSGEATSIDKAELAQKLQALHASIDSDETLKKLRNNLAKNVQTQALTELIENLSPHEVDFLLERLKPENQEQFRKDLWTFYIQTCAEASTYLDSLEANRNEIAEIESAAAQTAPRWTEAVELFNERFVDMPFTLSVSNQTQAVLGTEKAKLKFTFRDGEDTLECSRSEIKTLSQGEKRALYLLNFIFDVEARKIANQETLFIIDDVADSFDYKNKHAIIQYLNDLCRIDHFYQIILTHNFDFFRSLANTFVSYNRCLMANKADNCITLVQTKGIKNYFIGELKDKVTSCNRILCATIPFVRNLIEYTRGIQDPDYLKLTSLLHWKNDTDSITVGDYLGIYNHFFGSVHDIDNTKPVKELLFETATEICDQTILVGLNLESPIGDQ